MKLRVSHYPQIPCKPFITEVEDLKQAKFLFDVLANYDLFQYKNRIKPDYANTTTLEQWDEEEQDWVSWCDEETGIDDFDEYFESFEPNESAQATAGGRITQEQAYGTDCPRGGCE